MNQSQPNRDVEANVSQMPQNPHTITNLDFIILTGLCFVFYAVQQIPAIDLWFMKKIEDTSFFWFGIYKAFPVLFFIFYLLGAWIESSRFEEKRGTPSRHSGDE